MNALFNRMPHFFGFMMAWGLWTLVAGVQATDTPVITKSPYDERAYRHITLNNGLDAVLIADPQASQAAAALKVDIGQFHDPAPYWGIAHFTEHLLFMGTEKYPDVNDYSDFINRHGGSRNAFTSLVSTVYFFDVPPDHFNGALDRLAQFFIKPLFTDQYVEREKNAVDSEYKMTLKNDNWRLWHVLKQLAAPNHPLKQFSVGNLKTLSSFGDQTLRQAVVDFYNQHYSADRMHLVVSANQSLDELEQQVRQTFSAVKRKQLPSHHIKGPMFDQSKWPLNVDIKSIQDKHMLSVLMVLPSQNAVYRYKPHRYVANLFEQQGEGSLIATLKAKNWIESLEVSHDDLTLEQDMMSFEFKLTSEGLRHVNDVKHYFLQYLDLIKKQGVASWRFEEMKKMADLSFQYQRKRSAMDEVLYVIDKMGRYPSSELLKAHEVFYDFSEAAILDFLQQLKLKNTVFLLEDQQVETDRIEPYYQVPYRVEPIDSKIIQSWQQGVAPMSLAKPNPYIPSEVKPLYRPQTEFQGTPHRLLCEQPCIPAWCLADKKFADPKVGLTYLFSLQHFSNTASHAVLAELYLRLVKDIVDQKLYPAMFAGNHIQLYQQDDGIVVGVSGYQVKQLDKVLDDLNHWMFSPDIDIDRFNAFKEKLEKDYSNREKMAPYREAFQALPELLLHRQWRPQQKLKALESLTLTDLQAFIGQLSRSSQVRSFYYGNLHCDAVLPMQKILQKWFPLAQAGETVQPGVVALPPKRKTLYPLPSDHPDRVLAMIYQNLSKNSVDHIAATLLLTQVLQEPFFQQLRTERQMGYIVTLLSRTWYRHPHLIYLVQSPQYAVSEISKEMTAFQQRMLLKLKSLQSAQLMPFQRAVKDNLLKRPENLAQWVKPFWREIAHQTYDFAYRDKLAQAVMAMTPETLADFFTQLHHEHAACLLIASPSDPKLHVDQSIGDVTQFKQTQGSLPQTLPK